MSNFISFLLILIVFHITNSSAFEKDIFILSGKTKYDVYSNTTSMYDATVIHKDKTIKSDKMFYNKNSIIGVGNVQIFRNNELLLCDKLQLDIQEKKWQMHNLSIYNKSKDITVNSVLGHREGETYKLYKASYTPCQCLNTKPFWHIKAKEVKFDAEKNNLKYKNASLWIFDTPVFYTPYLSHTTSNTEAKSGLLNPKIKQNLIGLPFYYRFKSNIDLTLTSMFKPNEIFIQEFEFRHLLEKGNYVLNLDVSNKNNIYQNKSDGTNDESKLNKEKKVNQYFLHSKGDFYSNDEIFYGFNINFASNKKFIKKYYRIYDNSLRSEFYVLNTNKNSYRRIKILNFQHFPLSSGNKFSRVFSFNSSISQKNDNNSSIQYNNQIIFYEYDTDEQMNKNHKIRLSNNFLFYKNIYNEYVTTALKLKSNVYQLKNGKSLAIISPEFELDAKYGMFFKNHFIEPKLTINIHPTNSYDSNKKQYRLTDDAYNQNDFIGLMNSNHYYNSCDYYQSGSSIKYGIRQYTSTKNDIKYSISAGGVKYSSKNLHQIDMYNGSVRFDIGKNSIFYEINKPFNSSKKFFMHRIGSNYNSKNFKLDVSLLSFKINKKLYTKIDSNLQNTNQINIDSRYNLNQNWFVDNNFRFNVSKSDFQMVSKFHGLTYHNDCFRIFVRVYNDYLFDKSINLRKSKTYSVGVQLKTLN